MNVAMVVVVQEVAGADGEQGRSGDGKEGRVLCGLQERGLLKHYMKRRYGGMAASRTGTRRTLPENDKAATSTNSQSSHFSVLIYDEEASRQSAETQMESLLELTRLLVSRYPM